MSNLDIKFIATDMDGTLLNEQGELPSRFFEIFNQLKQKNILFSAASGRQYYSLIETFEPVKDDIVFIAENGTLVMHKGMELYSCTIPEEDIPDLISRARNIPDSYIVLCGIKSAYIETQHPKALKELGKYYYRCEYVDDLLSVKDDFIKIAICHFGGTEDNVYPVINEHFGSTHKVVVSARIWLDIMNISASKGDAVRQLQDRLGFSYEQTMSFGDYLNDTELLEESYYSFAMANAHDKIKELARFQAPSNQDEGVITTIIEKVLD
ncbi:Cof-type HAD-IIB family hydrolase [Vibrio salinus]|uniref:Cof-type HAD-IIB family hydrolase n=1 Tax=Vibrio salinus TaxID=2899784 RepID=UPI001E5128C8|nr:Cof-type HAD-IIB family hydrolase [Vibrio salinus]MCE0495730.1 Cof-type HAD-IIB family hydrolase [Vibrio salinus]